MASFRDVDISQSWADRVVRGDRRAFAYVYEQVGPVIMGMAYRMLGTRSAAEEVVQDVFVQLMEHAHALKESAALVAWLRKVAVNHCLMRIRSPWQQRRETLLAEPDMHSVDDDQRMSGMTDIERALAKLAPETRLVIWLHDVEGYTHKEIGELMGQTTSFSKSQLSRGYKALVQNDRGNNDDQARRPIGSACST